MELGRRIYAYRTKRNLSQGDLADALGVSRQSVSKWETGNATPDLDKLVKLSQLFGITLDELVGRQNTGTAIPSDSAPCAKSPARITVQQIIGVMLLCTGFLFLIFSFSGTNGTVVISQLVLSALCILCGTICLKFQKHAGFLCALVLYLFTWIPVGVLSPNYIRLDIARILQLSQILWGVLLGLHGHRLCKKGEILHTRFRAYLFLSVLMVTVLISFLILLFPGLLPAPGLHYSLFTIHASSFIFT